VAVNASNHLFGAAFLLGGDAGAFFFFHSFSLENHLEVVSDDVRGFLSFEFRLSRQKSGRLLFAEGDFFSLMNVGSATKMGNGHKCIVEGCSFSLFRCLYDVQFCTNGVCSSS